MNAKNIKWNQAAEVMVSCGVIRMSLQGELDWQILEAQKVPHLDRRPVSEIVQPIDRNPVRRQVARICKARIAESTHAS